jgi:hypothetical protein
MAFFLRKPLRWGNLYEPAPLLRFLLRAATAAAEAFFARAERSFGVIVSRERLPPIFPPLAPCLRKNSRTSAGSFFFAIHLS